MAFLFGNLWRFRSVICDFFAKKSETVTQTVSLMIGYRIMAIGYRIMAIGFRILVIGYRYCGINPRLFELPRTP